MIIEKLNIKQLIQNLKEAQSLGYDYIDVECVNDSDRDMVNFHVYESYKKIKKQKIKKIDLNDDIINALLN